MRVEFVLVVPCVWAGRICQMPPSLPCLIWARDAMNAGLLLGGNAWVGGVCVARRHCLL